MYSHFQICFELDATKAAEKTHDHLELLLLMFSPASLVLCVNAFPVAFLFLCHHSTAHKGPWGNTPGVNFCQMGSDVLVAEGVFVYMGVEA